jgi:SAM-dependent methyltransferase
MVTVGRRAYDLMYRFGAPWEGADRVELRALVADGRCSPATLRRPGAATARAIDLGCGAGGVSLELAEAGFEVTGVDFSPVALRKARSAARRRRIGGDRLRFVAGDLTAGRIADVDGPFDLLVDYGTLDDLPGDGRRAMARYVTRLARPGSRFFLYAFAGRPEDLPRFSFSGPSRAFPGIDDREVEALFGRSWRIEVLDQPTRTRHLGTWLLERTDHEEVEVDAANELASVPQPSAVAQPGAQVVTGSRLAGYALLVSAPVSALGVVALIAMYAAFAAGDRDTGMRVGFANDVSALVTYPLAAPAVLVLYRMLRPYRPTASAVAALAGAIGIAGIVLFQGLLVTGVLTFEQEIGPVAIAFLVFMAWQVATGYMGAKSGAIPGGLRLGIIGASYIGHPVWAAGLGRRMIGR